MKPGGRVLLVTHDTEKSPEEGPPYVVKPEEVYRAYEVHGTVELVDSIHYVPQDPNVGLQRIREDVFLVRLFDG
jgi:hypothetical protein